MEYTRDDLVDLIADMNERIMDAEESIRFYEKKLKELEDNK
tara:strand:+ start:1429 stop:1551 length:123 start_codon:yes stop_codon:yes gene_type:complete